MDPKALTQEQRQQKAKQEARSVLIPAAAKQADRRFSGEPVTGFGVPYWSKK